MGGEGTRGDTPLSPCRSGLIFFSFDLTVFLGACAARERHRYRVREAGSIEVRGKRKAAESGEMKVRVRVTVRRRIGSI